MSIKMKMLIILLISVSFLQSGVGSFDQYMLAQTWPAGFCQTQTCIREVNKFSIHGLWPQEVDPSTCPEAPELKLSQGLMTKLRADWQSLTEKVDDNFWKREWQKHGSCSLLKSEDYFTIASLVYRKHDIKAILKKSDIGAKVIAESFSRKQFEEAIHDKIGVNPQFHCDDQHNLVELRLCFDKNYPHDYRDCSASASCPDDGIIFQYSYKKHAVMTQDDPTDPEEDQLPRAMPPL